MAAARRVFGEIRNLARDLRLAAGRAGISSGILHKLEDALAQAERSQQYAPDARFFMEGLVWEHGDGVLRTLREVLETDEAQKLLRV